MKCKTDKRYRKDGGKGRGRTDGCPTTPKDQPVNVGQLLVDIRKAKKGLPGKPATPKTPQKYMSAEEIAAEKKRREAELDSRMDTIKVVKTDGRGNVLYETSTTIPHGSIKTPPPKPVMTLEQIRAEDRAAATTRRSPNSARPPKKWKCNCCGFLAWHDWKETKCFWCECRRGQAKNVSND